MADPGRRQVQGFFPAFPAFCHSNLKVPVTVYQQHRFFQLLEQFRGGGMLGHFPEVVRRLPEQRALLRFLRG